MRWYVQVQIEIFLIEICLNFVVDNGNGKVHEVDFLGRRFTFPCKALASIHILTEVRPELSISNWIRIWNPDANDIINKPFIKIEVLTPTLYQVVLIKGIIKYGPGWRWRRAHGCARYLLPIGVTKFQEVEAEN